MRTRRGLLPMAVLAAALLLVSVIVPVLISAQKVTLAAVPGAPQSVPPTAATTRFWSAGLPTDGVSSTQVAVRSFDLHQTFDTDWAHEVSKQAAIPAVVLRFSADEVAVATPSADGAPLTEREKLRLQVAEQNRDLNYSLLAIANGAQDDALRAWARQLRAFGAAVYLAPLAEVDSEAGQPSALRQSAMPSDVDRTWAHIQSIFAQEGVTNVIWLWSPATTDAAYLPPVATIDAQLVRAEASKTLNVNALIHTAKMRLPNAALLIDLR
jgi:hypothetical protein